MIAKITIFDDDGKEVISAERKVFEYPTFDDEGHPYTNCYAQLKFSIAEGDSNDIQ